MQTKKGSNLVINWENLPPYTNTFNQLCTEAVAQCSNDGVDENEEKDIVVLRNIKTIVGILESRIKPIKVKSKKEEPDILPDKETEKYFEKFDNLQTSDNVMFVCETREKLENLREYIKLNKGKLSRKLFDNQEASSRREQPLQGFCEETIEKLSELEKTSSELINLLQAEQCFLVIKEKIEDEGRQMEVNLLQELIDLITALELKK
ncbi:hypothetical protein DMENIID0001_120700 [Sergentomyia squamirostris]